MSRILIVDDIDENRYLLEALLRGNGFEVDVARNGAEALRLAKESPPDLIVTDIMMPEMDGFELCRRWKRDERLRDIPFVVYTATYTDPRDEHLALSLGADRFLVKPQSPDDLLRVLREVFDRSADDPGTHLPDDDGESALLAHNEALTRKLGKKVRDLESEIARRNRIESALRDQERKYRLLTENALDVVWAMGLDGELTYVSSAVEKLLGYRPEEIMNRPLDEILAPEGMRTLRTEIDPALADLAQGRSLDWSSVFEIEQWRRDGAAVWTEVTASVMRDETGAPIGLQGVFRDISRRRRAEMETRFALEDLARAKNELEGLLDGARAILEGAEFAVTARRIFDIARDITRAKSGYMILLGEPDEEDELILFEPGDIAFARDAAPRFTTANLIGEAFRQAPADVETSLARRWAAILPDERMEPRAFLAVPLVLDGRTIGIMSLANKPRGFDSDDRRIASAFGQLVAVGFGRWRTEQRLVESEALMRIAGRMARLGGWSVDLRDRRIRWSDEVAAILEMAPGGSPTVEEGIAFYAPEWRARISEVFETCARDGVPYDEVLEVVTTGGRRVWVRAIGEALRDSSDRIVKVQGTLQDITEIKRAEEERRKLQNQLVHSQKIDSIGRLAGGIAHDFNNLLSVVLSYAEFAIDAVREGDPLRADLEEIRRAGVRAAALTRQLLAFSRKQIMKPEVIDLNGVVSSLESMLKRLLGENIEVAAHLAPDLGRVMADVGQIEQVLMNLAVNARDAMPKGGRLTIETDNAELDAAFAESHFDVEPGRYVMLAVSDTGIGMDAATMEHIFEPFFTTKEKGQGTGLGLSTIYGIVKQSGGHIWADSEPGAGTTFKLYLPRVDAQVVAAAAKETEPAAAAGSETVLVVEDEAAVRRITERILRHAGFNVLAAGGGGDALLLCEKFGTAIDLLLTDVVMPQMSGGEVADRLRRMNPDLKVLYMSGYADDAIAHESILKPGTPFIGKPFSAADLTRKVREVLDGH